jgi:GcrA cell cycle regulator
MQPFIWTPEHCRELRDYRARGLSYGEIARRLNTKFGTTYTRNAALGRGMRMGLPSPKRPRNLRLPGIKPQKQPKTARMEPRQERPPAESIQSAPAPARARPVTLRCVGITPRLLSLIELGPNDCRYPYGGDKDGEAITFCSHPKLPGTSYCAPHFDLTRGDDASRDRPIGPVLLRLVDAA